VTEIRSKTHHCGQKEGINWQDESIERTTTMEIHDHHLPIHYKAFMEYDNNLIKVIKDVFSWSWASHYHLSVCNEVYCG